MKIIKGILFFLFLFPFLIFADQKCEVLEDQVNVRIDATVLSDSLGQLKKGEELRVLEERFNEWYKIILPQRFSCYVWGEFFKEIEPNKGRVAVAVLNLRNKPDLDAYIVGKAKKGDVFAIVDKNDGWVQIKGYPRTFGWVHKKFIKTIDSAQEKQKEAVIAQQKLEEETLDQLILQLGKPLMSEKKSVHDQLINMGSSVVSKLESILPTSGIYSKYSIIYILSRIGKNNIELALDFLMKVDSISDVELAGIYLDIIQDIVEPRGEKVPYFHLVKDGRLTMSEIKEARNYLHREYNRQVSLSRQELSVLQ
ncbi:MAG: SH3 domain-containing protein [Candidatus Omnitrophota bacterium]|nr:SH3 domain-containing protein [Candidatus Omnitrophota bacterium]